jgi:ribosomal protein S27AE
MNTKTCPYGHSYTMAERLGPNSPGCPICRRRKQNRRADKIRASCPKAKCRLATRYAITIGKLLRGPCEKCGSEVTEAHHDDYSKPLEVRWLCQTHHYELHLEKGDMAPRLPPMGNGRRG